jgi:nucleotide-binding universal stress UspA family protein
MQFQRILVPVDFSKLSRQALEEAVTLAEGASAQLTVLHVHEHVDMPPVDPAYRPEDAEETQRKILAALSEQLERFVEGLSIEDARLERRVVAGNAVDEILEASKIHDLVVMSTHGRRALGDFMLGTVTERVVRHARCSTLVVRPR